MTGRTEVRMREIRSRTRKYRRQYENRQLSCLTACSLLLVTDGNFNGNDEGREQLIFVTSMKQNSINDARSRVYCYYYNATIESNGSEHGYEGKSSDWLTDGKGSFHASLATQDTDNDSTRAQLQSVSREYTAPYVMAILEAAPHFAEIEDADEGNSETIYGSKYVEGTGSSNSFGFTLGTSVGYEFERSLAQSGVGFELALEQAFNWSTANTRTTTWFTEYSINASSVTKSGKVSGKEVEGYDFQWKFAAWNCKLDGITVPVTGYLVKDTVAPPPVALAVEDATTNSATLCWESSIRAAAQYRIYRVGDSGDTDYVLVGAVSGNETGYTLNGLMPGEAYTYVVRGVAFNWNVAEETGFEYEDCDGTEITLKADVADSSGTQVIFTITNTSSGSVMQLTTTSGTEVKQTAPATAFTALRPRWRPPPLRRSARLSGSDFVRPLSRL